MQFSPDLRDRVADANITVPYRLWSRPKDKVGSVYRSGTVMIEIDDVDLMPFSSMRNREPARARPKLQHSHAGPDESDEDPAMDLVRDSPLSTTNQATPFTLAKFIEQSLHGFTIARTLIHT